MRRAKTPQAGNDQQLLQHSRRRFLFAGAALAGATLVRPASAAPRSADDLRLSVERSGDAIFVSAQAEAGATIAQAFATLVDYDRLADFIPDVAASRTVARTGSSALVEQRGRATFGPFHQTFSLMLAVEEIPGVAIRAAAAGGDFRRFDATYELAAIDARTTRIDYHAVVEPTAGVPPLVGVAIMRSVIRRQFEAMIGEIDRRGAIG